MKASGDGLPQIFHVVSAGIFLHRHFSFAFAEDAQNAATRPAAAASQRIGFSDNNGKKEVICAGDIMYNEI